MMTSKTLVALATCAAACASLPAHAVNWTVDTGTPTASGNALLLSTNDFVAGQVDLGASTRIDAVQAYVADGASGETFTIALYGENAGHPAGDALYSATATAGNGAGWYGVSSLGWALTPGSTTYWVAVEMSGTDTLGGGAGGTLPVGVASPLAATAFYDGSGSSYHASAQNLQFGLRVAAVPEPAEAAMLALGLGVIGAVARRRRAG